MNLYFILEGERTEVLLYPKWINFVLPNFTQVFLEKDVKDKALYDIEWVKYINSCNLAL